MRDNWAIHACAHTHACQHAKQVITYHGYYINTFICIWAMLFSKASCCNIAHQIAEMLLLRVKLKQQHVCVMLIAMAVRLRN